MKRVTILAIVAAALLVGCGKPQDKYVGMWEGTMEIPPEFAELMRSMAEGMAKSTGQSMTAAEKKEMEDGIAALKDMKLTLDLKKDGTCTMGSNAPGQNGTTAGTWLLSEDKKSITLTMQQGDGATIGQMNRAIVFVIGADGKSMTFEDNQMGMKTKLSFTKK